MNVLYGRTGHATGAVKHAEAAIRFENHRFDIRHFAAAYAADGGAEETPPRAGGCGARGRVHGAQRLRRICPHSLHPTFLDFVPPAAVGAVVALEFCVAVWLWDSGSPVAF